MLKKITVLFFILQGLVNSCDVKHHEERGSHSPEATKDNSAKLNAIFDKYFKFLTTDFGYIFDSSDYHSGAEYIIYLSKENKKIKIISDRDQIFIDIFTPGAGWRDKEAILEDNGIMRTRHKTTNGLWNGYEIENQSSELKKYKEYLKL